MHVKHALELEDIIRNNVENPQASYWTVKIKPMLNATFAVVFCILSLIILLSECTLLLEGRFDEIVYKVYTFILTETYIQAIVYFIHLKPRYLHCCSSDSSASQRITEFFGSVSPGFTDSTRIIRPSQQISFFQRCMSLFYVLDIWLNLQHHSA